MNADSSENLSRAEIAYLKLFEAIEAGEIKPGSRVREVDIAKKYGISRTPVREAIHRLENDGLIVHLPRHGATIRQLSEREIIEMYQMREVLEGTAARYAAKHASDLEIEELTELNELMLQSIENPVEVAAYNRLFHKCLYRAANNRYLIKAIASLSNAMALLDGTTLETKNRIKAAYQEHLEIIANISKNDQSRAEKSVHFHIHQALRTRIQMFRN